MKRNCNLELRLVTPSLSSNSDDHFSMLDMKKLTVFYKGRVVTCDATEIQAREIISLANAAATPRSPPPPPNMPVYSAAAGLSMKRSLQRFLEKRKRRAQSTSPYMERSRNDN